jgi:Mg2+ and Co2+ transporter CorA
MAAFTPRANLLPRDLPTTGPVDVKRNFITVVASFMYRDGKRAEELPLSPTPISFKDNEFAWIGLNAPGTEEMAKFQQAYGSTSLP